MGVGSGRGVRVDVNGEVKFFVFFVGGGGVGSAGRGGGGCWTGLGGQGRCERGSEVFVKIKKKN